MHTLADELDDLQLGPVATNHVLTIAMETLARQVQAVQSLDGKIQWAMNFSLAVAVAFIAFLAAIKPVHDFWLILLEGWGAAIFVACQGIGTTGLILRPWEAGPSINKLVNATKTNQSDESVFVREAALSYLRAFKRNEVEENYKVRVTKWLLVGTFLELIFAVSAACLVLVR